MVKEETDVFRLRRALAILLLSTVFVLPVMAAEDTSLHTVLDAGKLVLGLDTSFPPMGFIDPATGETVGFDIDLAQEVATRLGVELVCQPINWDAKEMELNAGNIDCIWNGMTITPARLESMNVSMPYLRNEQVLVVRSDAGISSPEDLAGKTLGLQAGSSANDALDAAEEFKATLGEVIPFDENLTALMDLNLGGLDAVLADIVVVDYYTKVNDYPFTVLAESLAPEEYGIAFRKADDALRVEVEKVLLEMKEDGTLQKISEYWFGEDITVLGE